MRLILVTIAVLLSQPVQADVFDQFAAARSVFGTVDPATILDDLDGDWVELMGYSRTLRSDSTPEAVRTYAEESIAMTCGSPDSAAVMRIEAAGAESFTIFSAKADSTIRFDWIEKRPIASHVPSFLRTSHKAGDEAYRPAPQDGPVAIYRPSSEILIVNEAAGTTAIWGRCPAMPVKSTEGSP